MVKGLKFDLAEFRGRAIPSESEIMVDWNGDLEQPVVSILCNTFNQENYIEDAIRGFLLQKTDFPFEIIISDDASTDNNANIIRRYAEKYPKIIKPVFQNKNQYSQGKKPTIISFQYARGKYIALCEGDDFWICSTKLQRQCDLLNREPNFDGCAHPAWSLSINGQVGLINRYNEIVLDCNTVCEKGGGVVPTASLLVRRKVIEQFSDLFSDAPLGDYFIQVLASKNGGLAFHQDACSVYRLASVTSVSNGERLKSAGQMRQFAQQLASCVDRLNEELGGQYSDSILQFKASMYKEASMRALVYAKNKVLFREFIELSSFKFVSSAHYFMFHFRRYPWFLSALYRFRELVFKSKNLIVNFLGVRKNSDSFVFKRKS